jgi:glycosyltransferase involved in cell wall biosynthesis
MRILQLHNRHGSRGGADEVMDLERDLLVGAGHDVDQITVGAGGSRSAVRDGVAAVWNRGAVAAVGDHIDVSRPDVVHVHTPFPVMSPAVFRVASKRGCATVATCHSYRYSCIRGTLLRDGALCESCVGSRLKLAGVVHGCYHDSRVASIPMTASLALHRAIGTFDHSVDRFVAMTDFARALLVRDGVDARAVAVKPNAVPDPGEPFPAADRGPHVVFVGRLVEEKGIQTLMDAARLAPDVRVVVAGDGPLRPLVEQTAAALPTLEYLGWVSEQLVTELLATASVAVIPSEWYEAAAPLTLLRALALGTPVVCSDLENICGDVRRYGAGRVFQTGSAPALAQALGAALADADWRARASAEARALYLRRHTPSATVDALEAIYAEAVATRAAR